MRILLFFLVVCSFSSFGQNRFQEAAEAARKKTNVLFGMSNSQLRSNQPVYYSGHTHKWVELHQDTVTIYKRGNFLSIEGQHVSIHGEGLPLICLICHQEKKKTIHYKKSK